MADIEIGQIFLDMQATNYYQSKPKYHIALSSAEYDDDNIICFVINTEHNIKDYALGCNKSSSKFIISQGTFSFITKQSAIMLHQEVLYILEEMYKDSIKLLEVADIELCRQIKNCIDFNDISVKFGNLIKECFKSIK
jgi:hypothetical protein